MNIKVSYKLGVLSGEEAGRLGDFTETELQNEESFMEAGFEICENKRQYAGHPGEIFNNADNSERSEGLWDAFDSGEAVGLRKAWRKRKQSTNKKENQ